MSCARSAARSWGIASGSKAASSRNSHLHSLRSFTPGCQPLRNITRACITTRAGTNTTPVDTESSVARGTRYELLCRDVLKELFGMQLDRTGGAGDRGIDLRGWLQPDVTPTSSLPSNSRDPTMLPDLGSRIRIVAQCKCQDEGGKKMGPVLIREVEGVVFRASSPPPSSDQGEEGKIAGVILSSSGFSKQALLQVRSSSVPLAALHVVAEQQAKERTNLSERCVSVVWNDKFGGKGGLVAEGMEARWVRSLAGVGEGRPVIWRGGLPLKA